MEIEKTMIVLTEILEDQKEIMSLQKEVIETMKAFKESLQKIESSATNPQTRGESIDIKSAEQLFEKEISELKILRENLKQKTTQNNLRVFLESDAKRWAVYAVVALTFLTYLYWFSVHK